jgi:methylenetetrahydrofolate reductase (NADPH)
MAEMSSSEVPGWFIDRLSGAHNAVDAKHIGIELASELCRDLIEAGAPGLHLYTLNRSEIAKDIRVNLGSVLV